MPSASSFCSALNGGSNVDNINARGDVDFFSKAIGQTVQSPGSSAGFRSNTEWLVLFQKGIRIVQRRRMELRSRTAPQQDGKKTTTTKSNGYTDNDVANNGCGVSQCSFKSMHIKRRRTSRTPFVSTSRNPSQYSTDQNRFLMFVQFMLWFFRPRVAPLRTIWGVFAAKRTSNTTAKLSDQLFNILIGEGENQLEAMGRVGD